MCTNKDIQELLPAYLERSLADDERSRVEQHLSACDDCRADMALLNVLAAEPVPDPGDAFWAALPGKVHRRVAEERLRTRSWWGSRVPMSLALPRWAWATAAVLIVAAFSWLLVRPAPVQIARVAAPVNGAARTVLLPVDQIDLAALTDTEIDAVDLWATEELSILQEDVIDILRASADTNLDDRLAELNTEELEELSRMLDIQDQEG